jgi:hypothetical protein
MGCCARKNCDRPKEEMMSSEAMFALLEDGSWAITKLLELAKSGIRSVGFKNERLSELAAAISAIVAENNYLKSLLGVGKPDTVTTTNDGVTIFFGPRGEYSLFIFTPTQETRNKLAANLIAAGKELQQKNTTEIDPRQQFLPFDR